MDGGGQDGEKTIQQTLSTVQARDDSVWGQGSTAGGGEMWLKDLGYIWKVELVRQADGLDVEGGDREKQGSIND